MDAQAGMLARLFEHSMGLGPEWRVEDVWFESPASGDEELHVRVGRVPGAAVACPECGARCGVYDARERTWRHLFVIVPRPMRVIRGFGRPLLAS